MLKCVRSLTLALALLVLGGLISVASATDITLPDVGVDVSAYITAALVTLGAVVATAVGAWFSFLIVRKALKWARKAM